MTLCTLCGLPTAGHDDDDTACCTWCTAANLAPPPPAPGWLRREIAVPYCDREAAIAFGLTVAAAWRYETLTDTGAGPPP